MDTYGYFYGHLPTFRIFMDIIMDMNIQSLAITPEILALIAEIDEFKGAWRALGQLAPEQLTALVS